MGLTHDPGPAYYGYCAVEAPAEHFQLMRDRSDVRRLRDLPEIDAYVKLPLKSEEILAVAKLTKLSRVRWPAPISPSPSRPALTRVMSPCAVCTRSKLFSDKHRVCWRSCS